MSNYLKNLNKQFYKYCELRFSGNPDIFDRPPEINNTRPPVFRSESADLNVLTNPDITKSEQQQLLDLLSKWHRWFGSMKSSQALAQTVFGNLLIAGKLNLLSTLRTDDGRLLFGSDSHSIDNCILEHSIRSNPFKEKAPTEIDVFFPGKYQVAVECKFTEDHVGSCSIPERKSDECDGNLHDRSGFERCYLNGRGIKYWEYIPALFEWDFKSNYSPCPLQLPYQLVRNILSVCIREDGAIDPDKGHAVLVYDDRNPAFQSDGIGELAWQQCNQSLKYPWLLQKCSWQTIVKCLRHDSTLRWLTDEIDLKYGIR